MNREDKVQLRGLRDDMADENDKRLIRKALTHIENLEQRLFAVKILSKSVISEANWQGKDGE